MVGAWLPRRLRRDSGVRALNTCDGRLDSGVLGRAGGAVDVRIREPDAVGWNIGFDRGATGWGAAGSVDGPAKGGLADEDAGAVEDDAAGSGLAFGVESSLLAASLSCRLLIFLLRLSIFELSFFFSLIRLGVRQ